MGSYQSVKRFVRRLKARQPERVWRIECQPGEEMQVDFGLGAPIEHDDGKTRRSWVLRAVLSYSRKGYSEAVMRQDTESLSAWRMRFVILAACRSCSIWIISRRRCSRPIGLIRKSTRSWRSFAAITTST